MRQRSWWVSGSLLVGLSLVVSGCVAGPGANAPADASEAAFCAAWRDTFAVFARTADRPTSDQWRELQLQVELLAEVGTPSDLSADDRAGFESMVNAIAVYDYDDTLDAGALPGVVGAREREVAAFNMATAERCGLPAVLEGEQDLYYG